MFFVIILVFFQDKDRDLPTLFVICGDHGMSDMGSHGGASQKEIETPLVFLSSAFSGQKGKCSNLEVWICNKRKTLICS